MIMNEEKIEEAAENYVNSIVNQRDNSDYSQDVKNENARFDEYDIQSAFFSGANWAIENQWHDASKELPEDGIKVIVLTEKGNAAINSVYTFNGNRRWHSNYAVLFWMPIPSLSKELK
jgi:hypothetical protein